MALVASILALGNPVANLAARQASAVVALKGLRRASARLTLVLVASVVAILELIANEVPRNALAISTLESVLVAACKICATLAGALNAIAPAQYTVAIFVARLAIGARLARLPERAEAKAGAYISCSRRRRRLARLGHRYTLFSGPKVKFIVADKRRRIAHRAD